MSEKSKMVGEFPAFPVPYNIEYLRGMDTRTYIANEQFPFALSEARRATHALQPRHEVYAEAAKRACEMADALLKELAK